jgi:hypothetical protein
MPKKIFLTMCVVAVFSCSLQAAAMRKGPYLYYPGDNTEMTVLWQLHEEPEPVVCTLEWGTDETYSIGTVDSNEYGEDHQYKYTISGLTPGSKYYYRVTADAVVSEGTFYAAPPADATSLKFLAYGDTRSHPWLHDRVCAAMADSFDMGFQTLALLSGDFVGSGTKEEDWDIEYFGGVGPGYYYDDGNDVDPNFYENTRNMLANLPLNACVGNHEALSQTLFPKYWPYPFVDGFYWSFEYGPALFVIVDQYRSARLTDKGPKGHGQLPWLENTLKNSDKEWKFIVLHAPGYSADGGHKDDADVQRLIQPLCLEYGVDIVFGGHNHYYARCEVEDVQHITTGGGGAPLRDPEPEYNWDIIKAWRKALNYCEITIDGNDLWFDAWDANEVPTDPNGNRLLDSFTIEH